MHANTRTVHILLRRPGELLLAAFGLTLLLLCYPRALRAGEPACSTPTQCHTPSDIVWTVTTMSATITPDGGGLIDDGYGHFSISLPPHAVDAPLLVTATSTLTSATPVASPLVALGYFSLTAADASGAEHDAAELAWTSTFTYAECAGSAPCLLAQVDEASLRCLRLDASTSAWLAVTSQANVFANRVTCTTTRFGDFALVADPLRTAGETDTTRIFLPLLIQQQ